jgi:septal ring factor EnvC (AmiA/AmiB activator)
MNLNERANMTTIDEGEQDRILRLATQQRLAELQAEYAAGDKLLAELEAKQSKLRETMLRISGAIQILQELLATTTAETPVSQTQDANIRLVTQTDRM